MVGQAFLSSFLEDLINRLDLPETWDFIKKRNPDSRRLLKNLKKTLISLNKVQDDAEEKQITDSLVKKWLNELKDAVYDADDLLDQIVYETYNSNLEDDDSQSFLHPAESTFASPNLYDEEPKLLLEKILERLVELEEEMYSHGLTKAGSGYRPSLHLERRTTSVVDDESDICGRVDDKEAIIKLLLPEDTASGNGLGVIAIVGMGGIGKTTLARFVYEDHRVMTQFEKRAWICVSDETDAFKVVGNVLKTFSPELLGVVDSMTPDLLHNQLRNILMGKKFFLVLDDVWNAIIKNWEDVLKPLKFGSQGSRIIVTTRIDEVASKVCTIPAYSLKVLSDKESWSLFVRCAFKDENSSAYPVLEAIGKEIVRKCKGLPLAAKALGCLLERKRDVAEWERILKSNLWNMEDGINILPALRLSYIDLPSTLKRCFAYCAIYPKDYKFAKDKLIHLWMAEGLLPCQKGNKSMEEVGDRCFDDLLSRSFFQVSSASSSHFVMHDLINDLAKSIAGDFCFRFEGDGPSKLSRKTRHLSYAPHIYNASERFQGIYQNTSLRTFLPIHLIERKQDRYIGKEVIQQFLSKFKRLRVLSLIEYVSIKELPESTTKFKHLRYLDLSRTGMTRIPDVVKTFWNLQTLLLDGCRDLKEVPDSITNLKHLRYLDLSRTGIMRLPNGIYTLQNLQTLLLEDCKHLEELPNSIVCLKFLQCLNLRGTKIKQLPIHLKNLINLYALDIRGTKLQEMPPQLGNLTRLQQLSDFFVGKQTSSSIKELKELAELQGEICIWSLQNVENAQDALQSNMKGKKHLKRLELSWEDDVDDSQCDREVLEGLEAHSSLKYLSITGYKDIKFPDWVGNSCFSKLVSLILKGCKYCSEMPPLGQLESLKELYVVGFDSIVRIDSTVVKSLEVLRFEDMPQWMIWQQEDGAFPCLRELCLLKCPNLKEALPRQLPFLTELEIEKCDDLLTDPFPWAPAIVKLRLTDNSRRIEYWGSFLHLYRFNSLNQSMEEIQQMGVDLSQVAIHGYGNNTCINSLQFHNCQNLAKLGLSGLKNLKSLPERMHSLLPFLVDLWLRHCPQLESFPEGGLPSKLESLSIQSCDKLIAGRMQWNLQALPSLKTFRICGCEDVMESFPEATLLPSTLTSLDIWGFVNLKSLDYKELQQLTRLQHLLINSCDKLEKVPEDRLPPTLTSLEIHDLKSLKSTNPTIIQHLTSLTHLSIFHCPKLPSVPEVGLPSTITSLKVWGESNRKSLDSKGLRHLTCLTELEMHSCSELESITEEALPSSLRKLRISFCSKLQYLPQEGLPSSLEYLLLYVCPLLEEKCEWEGEYWPMISHIPRIQINYRHLK